MDSAEANSDSNIISYYDDHAEAEEDTLSLCDYSINSADDAHEQEEVAQAASSYTDDQDQLFEFCTEEWSTPTPSKSNLPENIMFCGKIIGYSKPSSEIGFQESTSVEESKLIEKPVEIVSFRWNGSHNICSSSSTSRREKQNCNNKVSVLNSSGKLKWSLFLFGGSSRILPKEIDLRDIKGRQSRKILCPSLSSSLFGLESNIQDKKTESSISNVRSKNRNSQGIMRLIKAIGSGTQHHANNVVKVSVGCFPRF